jgi:hypothetical protein
MYNYIMYIMYAIEQERDAEYNRKQGTKTQAQIAKERTEELKKLLGDDTFQKEEMITIEVTPEDMKKAKEEKEERQKAIKERRRLNLPSGAKVRSSRK